ncbi:MAG: hypothetical protein HUK03_01995 [Bacteroidaceae bacterium]|nr:hypothetical protein [Bacteroidaceae bacterium]
MISFSTGFQSQQCDYVAWGSMFWMPTMLLFMLTGRLEIFTVLFLFIPSFWRDRI